MGGRILLAVVGVAVGLALTEAASRVLERFVCHNVYSGTMIRSRDYRWGHRPGAAGWQQFCGDGAVEWRTWIRINAAGLRERDVPEERRGGFRVLAIGDSFVEGYQVPDERTFTRTTGYFAVDPHWTDAGHTLAARVTDEGLRRLGLVPTSAPASAP